MKKRVLLIIFVLSIVFIPNVKAEELTENQKAVLATADAYFNKKSNIQYCENRRNNYFSPEEATKDSTKYMVCTGFTFNTYRETFGMKLPVMTYQYTAVAKKYPNDSEVIKQWNYNEFINKINNESGSTTEEKVESFINELYTDNQYKLQPGDLLIIQRASSGHIIMIDDYDRFEFSSGKLVNAGTVHSTSNYKKDNVKLGSGISYSTEGTVQTNNLKTHLVNYYNNIKDITSSTDKSHIYLTIFRPLANANTYNEYSCIPYKDGSPSTSASVIWNPDNFECTKETKSYSITSSTKSRLKYPGIDIDKIVTSGTTSKTIINNSTVTLNDELIYKITISNKGTTNYSDTISLVENISDLVEFKEFTNTDGNTCSVSDNKVHCTIKKLNSTQTTTVEYKVKVKNDVNNLDKKIASTGSVDTNIKTATITNLIKADIIDESKIVDAYNELKNSTTLSGISFINEVYKKANLGLEFNLDNFDITQLISNDPTSWKPVKINESNSYRKYVLNNYYSAIFNNTSYIGLKEWGVYGENDKLFGDDTTKGVKSIITEKDRATTFYKEHFKTGDIIIYKNNNDAVTKENGIYAFIYVNDNFYGINKLSDNTSRNKFDVNAKLSNNDTYLTTLLAKDYYVILRPSLEKTLTNNEVIVPDTGKTTSIIFTIIGSIIIVIGSVILIRKQKA